MRAIHRKAVRDLWRLRGQAIAIALVVAAGITMYVSMFTTLESLRVTQMTYYSDFRFADVFASCVRAPDSVRDRLDAVEGVARVETRVVVDVTLDVPTLDVPATGHMVGVPESGHPSLNDVLIREGRYIRPHAEDEVLVSENFAAANGYAPGDAIVAIVNGRRREFHVVGVALSPEFVYTIPPGEFLPDDRRYGVLWTGEDGLAAATDMKGAFDDVAIGLVPGVAPDGVIARVDEILAPYGGLGAVPRAEQLSHWFVANEIEQLANTGRLLPIVFMIVAAFLVNIVMTRLITTQREQIAALKAFGYSTRAIALHYTTVVLAIVLTGAVVGVAAGLYLGYEMTALYTEYFSFPNVQFRMGAATPLVACGVSVLAALGGAMGSVRRGVALPPAEAMQPPAPPTYRATLVERFGLGHLLSPAGRMIVRQLERRPRRSALTVLGIAMATAIMVLGYSFVDIIYFVMDAQENSMQLEDVAVTFQQPRSRAALHELEGLDGVTFAEPYRTVPVRLRREHRSRLAGITGIEGDARLRPILDARLRRVPVPRDGVAMSRVLAEALHVGVGETLTLEVLEGSRPVREVEVAALLDDFVGLSAYMDLDALNAVMREGSVVSGAYLATGPVGGDLLRDLEARPVIAGVGVKTIVMENFKELLAQNLLMSLSFSVGLSCIIAFGVVYNAVRISLSERAHELASLRVLGLTRAEVSWILLGEAAVLTLLALPLGSVLGHAMAVGSMTQMNSETMRFPAIVSSVSYSFGAAVIVIAALISAFIVRRRLDHLDLVRVLKTRA